MTEIQSILFHKHIWDIPDAYSWLINHDFKPIKAPHLTENYIRYRIKSPKKYKRFRTVKTHSGISLVLGFK